MGTGSVPDTGVTVYSGGAFSRKACPGLDPGWTPVFRRECDQA